MVVDDNKREYGMGSNFANLKPIREEKLAARDEVSEKQLADGEYLKSLQKALQNAINENEELREKIKLLVTENTDLREEIDDKNYALIELAQFYEFCQKNHKVCDSQGEENSDDGDAKRKIKHKRKSKSL